MTEVITIATGIDAAIGCDYRRSERALYFVEYGGSIARYDLVRDTVGTVSTGTDTIVGTYQYDLDTGQQGAAGDDDVWWEIITDGERKLVSLEDAAIAYLGDVDYDGISSAEVQDLDYDRSRDLSGSDTDNELFEGAVFAVRTNDDNYAKVEVLDHGDDLQVRYRTYELQDAYQELGTGYDRPEDIVLGSDGNHAYVTERGGDVLRVDLDDADRSQATVLASGLTRPHQLALDDDHNQAYVVEHDDDGRLLRIDLTSGAVDERYSGLDGAVGLLVDDDRQFAYVTEQRDGGASGVLTRIELATGANEVLVGNLTAPFMLSWGSPTEDRVVFTERDPENAVSMVDLTTLDVDTLVDDVPFRPSSVALVSEDDLLVCSDDVLAAVDLAADLYPADAPLFMGIGHVPVTDISADGYATTQGPGYPLQTKNAPFGGRLPIMLNHERAYHDEGARYYRLLVDGDEPRQSWRQLKWTTSTNRFEPTAVSASSGGYYRIHRPGEIWYNSRLGYKLGTGWLTNGDHTITVKFYSDRDRSTLVDQEHVDVHIDNQHPRAEIGTIYHKLPSGAASTEEEIGACGIVDGGTDEFQLGLTAHDLEGHLRSWSLRTLWGDNESASIASDSYDDHDSSVSWAGIQDSREPSGWWSVYALESASARQCAHTFYLDVWGRTVNGYHHVHHSRYHKSITMLLPDPSS